MTEQLSSTPEQTPSTEGTPLNDGEILDMRASSLGSAEAGRRHAEAIRASKIERIVIPGHEQIAAISIKALRQRREEAGTVLPSPSPDDYELTA